MKRIFVLIFIIIAILGMFLLWQTKFSVNVEEEKELANYIENEKGVESVSILKTSQKGKFFAVLYFDGISEKMMVFEKNLLNLYQKSGGSCSSSEISTYNFNQSGSWSLIIVYGDNREVGAYSYEFVNNENKYGNKDLGEYILDIYVIENTKYASSDGYLFDKDGKKIMML